MAEARIAQAAIEVLSDSDPFVNSSKIAQIAIESLAKQDRIVNRTYVPQFAIESLSKEDRIVNRTYIPQFCIEVLSSGYVGSNTRWPHNFMQVPNADIQSIIAPYFERWTSVAGVA